MEILPSDSYNYTARQDRLRMEAEAKLLQAEAMADIAGKPAQKINPVIFLIPVAAIITLGIVVVAIKKRKK